MPSCVSFFPSFALAGNISIHISCYLLVLGTYRADLFLYFEIKCFGLFLGIQSFSFCLVNSEFDAYLPVGHSLVYSHSKMFLLFFSLILSLVLKPSFSIHILVCFCFLLLDLVSCRIDIEFCHQLSSACKSCFSILDSQWMVSHTK